MSFQLLTQVSVSLIISYTKTNNLRKGKPIMKKILVVVDMQNDFVDGALGSKEAVAIVPNVAEKITDSDADEIFVTLDTHFENYPETLEGKKLPVAHCIDGTRGHELNAEIKKALLGKNYKEVKKTTFGSFDISKRLKESYPDEEFEFEFAGLCTDVCVVSNVIIMRAAFPDAKITVDSNCCAGITPETHKAALDTMKSCQIDVIG